MLKEKKKKKTREGAYAGQNRFMRKEKIHACFLLAFLLTRGF